MNHAFYFFLIQSRQVRTVDHFVECTQTRHRVIDGGEGIICSKQQFVPDAVFLGKHKAVVKLPGAVVDGADVGVYDCRYLFE